MAIKDSDVRAYVAPESGSKTYWDKDNTSTESDADDAAIVGFGVRVHASGGRSFFLNYRVGGIEKRYTIGKWPTWKVARARSHAKYLRQQIDKGCDPTAERRDRKTAATIGELVERYVRDHLAVRKRARTVEEKRMLSEIAQILGRDTKVHEIHFGDMEELHKKITQGYGERKPRPVRANRVLAVASKMFSMSLRPLAGENKPWRDAVRGNPCKGIKRNHEEAAGRLYSSKELASISDALAAYPGAAADCIRLVMLTGCRPIEAKSALWPEFDAEPGLWNKPSSHTKQKKQHRTPLSPPALRLIEQLRANRAEPTGPVFPGRGPGGTIDALGHCWQFVRERAGLGKDARLYDLRHTFASLGAGGGLSLPILGRLLGHSSHKTTERYARHLADDPLLAAVTKIGDRITGAHANVGNVVTLPGARRP
jgi:integrase